MPVGRKEACNMTKVLRMGVHKNNCNKIRTQREEGERREEEGEEERGEGREGGRRAGEERKRESEFPGHASQIAKKHC